MRCRPRSPLPPAISATRSAPIASCSTGTKSSPTFTRSKKRATGSASRSWARPPRAGRSSPPPSPTPETLRNLDRYLEIQRRLADPRITTEAEAEKLHRARQDGRADHLLHPFHRGRLHAHRGRVRLPAAHRRQAALPRHSAEHDSAAGAVAQSGRRGHRDALVSPDAGHAVRRHVAAGALSHVRGPRQQSRLVHLLAAGNAADDREAAQRLASADRLRRAPAGAVRLAHLRAAVARSHRAECRRDPGAGDEHDRDGHGGGSDGGRQDGRLDSRRLRFLDARAALPGVSRRAAHSDRIGQRAPRDAGDHSPRAARPQRAGLQRAASEAGIIWSRGRAASGVCATSSITS